MKNIFKLIGIIAIVAVIGFGFVACDDGSGSDGGGKETLTYKGKGATSGDTYTLTIKKTAARAFTPIAGDEFELTDGTDKSKGTVNSFNGTNFTLQPSYQGSPTFGATVSGNDLIGLIGNITLTNGRTVTVSETLTPVTPVTPPSGNNTWTLVTDTKLDGIRSIAYVGGKFIAGSYDGKMAYSSDGKTWTAGTISTFGTDNINAIAYGGGKFVAGGEKGKVAYSSDGITWTAGTISTFGTDNINAIAYGGGKFVAGGSYGKMAYSSDGVTWTAVTNRTFNDTIYAIAYANDTFVAGGAQGQTAYSSDGVTWTDVDSKFGHASNQYIYAIAYGGSAGQEKFIAVGSFGKTAYSSDGIIWTAVDINNILTKSGEYVGINAIAYGGGKFVVGGYNGRTAYSSDGITWTAITDTAFFMYNYTSGSLSIPVYYDIDAIAYGNGTFVAVCNGSSSGFKMAYSTGL
jgi:hypothetical protein